MDDQQASPIEPTDDDYAAAESVIARMTAPPVRGTTAYEQQRLSFAKFRVVVGPDRFNLLNGLRLPRNLGEELGVAQYEGKVTLDEMGKRLRADAERPIDTEMLKTFHDYFVDRILAYSAMLRAIAETATNHRPSESGRRCEAEVDGLVQQMLAKAPLWKDQLATVHEFLAAMRHSTGLGLVSWGEFSSASAHRLAGEVIRSASCTWSSLRSASRTDSATRFGDSISASKQFMTVIDRLPRPNALMGLIEQEKAAADKAIMARPSAKIGMETAHAGVSHTETINLIATNVNLAQSGPSKQMASARPRMKREVAEPLIANHLMRRPHDTAKDVARAVGCAAGTVGKSRAWAMNQTRLDIARKQGVDPVAVRLNEGQVNSAGASSRSQRHANKVEAELIDSEIDEAELALLQKIGEFRRANPTASAAQVAAAIKCTSGDVERYDAKIAGLAGDQAQSASEEIVEVDDVIPHKKHQKWVKKEP